MMGDHEELPLGVGNGSGCYWIGNIHRTKGRLWRNKYDGKKGLKEKKWNKRNRWKWEQKEGRGNKMED